LGANGLVLTTSISSYHLGSNSIRISRESL
jgi:hypothetical protein